VTRLRNEPIETIASVPGIGKRMAERILETVGAGSEGGSGS
jgi:Holliday junction resolvasome RuvABC DNA-binding subunit